MPTFGTPSRFASRFGSGCAHLPQVRQLETWDLFGRYKSILQSRTKLAREPTMANEARVWYFGCTRAIDMPHVIPPSGGHHVIIVGRARSFSTQIRPLCVKRAPVSRS